MHKAQNTDTIYIYTRVCVCVCVYIHTDQKYKLNTFVFAPIFHELNSKI